MAGSVYLHNHCQGKNMWRSSVLLLSECRDRGERNVPEVLGKFHSLDFRHDYDRAPSCLEDVAKVGQ